MALHTAAPGHPATLPFSASSALGPAWVPAAAGSDTAAAVSYSLVAEAAEHPASAARRMLTLCPSAAAAAVLLAQAVLEHQADGAQIAVAGGGQLD